MRLDEDGSDSACVEIVGEEEAVAAAYVRLNDPHLQFAAAPLKHGDMDWNNHSHANVARRRAAGVARAPSRCSPPADFSCPTISLYARAPAARRQLPSLLLSSCFQEGAA